VGAPRRHELFALIIRIVQRLIISDFRVGA